MPLKSLTAAALAATLTTTAAMADGIDQMYDPNGTYLGELQLIGDVTDRFGGSYALFDFPSVGLNLYVPPEAVYVLMTRDNPIIANQTPFIGYWVGYAPQSFGTWAPCAAGHQVDHTGSVYDLYGDLRLTNLDLSPSGNLSFQIDLGFCGDSPQQWAVSEAFFEVANPPALGQPFWPDINEFIQICGNERDLTVRALGCSQVISHPEASDNQLSSAYWGRAYVRCAGATADEDIIADLVSAARIEPREWQVFYRDQGHYGGPIDGDVTFDLLDAIRSYVNAGC